MKEVIFFVKYLSLSRVLRQRTGLIFYRLHFRLVQTKIQVLLSEIENLQLSLRNFCNLQPNVIICKHTFVLS